MKLSKILSIILLTLFLTTLPLTTLAFSDVPVDHNNYQAIHFLRNKGAIQGYADDTFKPTRLINRAEFLKIILEAHFPETDFTAALATAPSEPCFTDVPADAWFAPYVCYAKTNDIISGYTDGTFKPSQNISLVEAAKITIEIQPKPQILPPSPVTAIISSSPKTNSVSPPKPWYQAYIQQLDSSQAIPPSIQYFNQNLTRSEIAEIIWRLYEQNQSEEAQDFAHTSADQLTFKPQCQPLGEKLPSNIDPDRIRQTWLSWMNAERATLGLHPYTYNDQLTRTATNWSNVSAARGYMDHKRPGTTAYYDYNAITSWYRDLGLEFANVNRVTHSENIGWDVYRCSATEADCTDHAISKLRNVFDFYMREKGQAYSAHYDSMTNRYFNEIGLGIAIDGGKIYYTTHYGTEITSDPMPVCRD